MRAPASSGPRIMPVWATVDCRAPAAGSSSAGTSRATEALRAGEFMPKKPCWAASSTMSSATESSPAKDWAQNSTEVTAMPTLVTSIRVRRSIRSATTPPHSAKTTSGRSPAKLA